MKALTLRHPWAFAVAHCGKDVENREWDDRLADLMGVRQMIGEQIAIHGGARPQRPKRAKHWSQLSDTNIWRQCCSDLEGLSHILERDLPDPAARYLAARYPGQPLTPEMFVIPGVVAVATIQRVTRTSSSRWAVPSQLHIELAEVITLPTPVQCPGSQGLWTLPPSIEDDVRQELTAWSRAQIPADSGRTAEEWLQ